MSFDHKVQDIVQSECVTFGLRNFATFEVVQFALVCGGVERGSVYVKSPSHMVENDSGTFIELIGIIWCPQKQI